MFVWLLKLRFEELMEASESLINSQGVIEVDQTTLDIPRFYLQRFLVFCPKLNFFSLLTWLCRGRALSATAESLHLKALTRQNSLCHDREPSFEGSDAAELSLPRQRAFIWRLWCGRVSSAAVEPRFHLLPHSELQKKKLQKQSMENWNKREL